MFNKPLKTRIKKVTTAGGEVTHYAQFKYFFQWYNFSDRSVTVWSHTTPRSVWVNSFHHDGGSVEMCMELIDEYIDAFHFEANIRNKGKVVNVEYIKYP